MRTNLEARLLTVNTGPLLAGYMHRPGQQIWIDEHAAKFIDAAANTPHRGMTSTSVLVKVSTCSTATREILVTWSSAATSFAPENAGWTAHHFDSSENPQRAASGRRQRL